MDALTFSTSLATIVGLICNFRQERGDRQGLNHRDFIEWLGYHHHEELKNRVLDNKQLLRELDELLKQNQAEIVGRLKAADDVLASILASLDGFSGLVHAVIPDLQLSNQAKEILVLFDDSEAQYLILMKTSGRSHLCLSPGGGIEVDEPRFLEDDLNTLVSYGFLDPDFGGNGTPLFRLTRAGAAFAKLVKGQQESIDREK